MIYVDGGSPPGIKRYIEARARERGFPVIRTEYYLYPNEARNLTLGRISSEYVAFVENDVIVAPGWLDALVRCAEETGAWIVAPIYCWEDDIIHTANGVAGIREVDGKRVLFEDHAHANEQLADVRPHLERVAACHAEFHCMLVRRDVFDKLGPLDEKMVAVHEHADLCHSVRQAGGSIYFEPDSVVAYRRPPPLRRMDLPYFVLRWSDEWCLPTFGHINRKYDLQDDHYGIYHRMVRPHRAMALAPARERACRLLGPALGNRLLDWYRQRIIDAGLRARRDAGLKT
jgi:hypothetical protein